MIMKKILTTSGFDVTACDNGLLAVEAWKRERARNTASRPAARARHRHRSPHFSMCCCQPATGAAPVTAEKLMFH